MLIPYGLILMYVLHEKPKFFVAALLAMNGTGTMLILEWSNRVVLGNTKYDTPVLRFGKSFATLGVALGIAATFQVRRAQALLVMRAHGDPLFPLPRF